MPVLALRQLWLPLTAVLVLSPAAVRADEDEADEASVTIAMADGDGGAAEASADEGSQGEELLADGGEADTPIRGADGGVPYGVDAKCLEQEQATGPLGDLLGALRLEVGATKAPIQEVRLTGLTTLDHQALAALVAMPLGPLEQPLSPEVAAVLVARLAGTGLFEKVTPQVIEELGGHGVLQVELHEYPRITRVELRGLSESKPEDLLRVVLQTPMPYQRHGKRKSKFSLRFISPEVDDVLRPLIEGSTSRRSRGCGWARPPSAWIALPAGATVVPGIIWHGVPRALDRVMDHLRGRGYLLAKVQAHLGADGVLAIEIDEGRIGSVEVVGVHPAVEAEVRQLLGVKAGDVFLASDVHRGIERVESRLPFLEAVKDHVLRRPPVYVVAEPSADGSMAYHFADQAPVKAKPADQDSDDGDDDGVVATATKQVVRAQKEEHEEGGAELHDGRLVFYFEAHPWTGTAMDWFELFRHTQVTGLAPGLGGTFRYSDPGDRVHVAIDAQFNVNTRRPSVASNGDLLAQLGSQQRIDWLVGPKVQIPGIDIAEAGVQAHSLTDTNDRWHINPVDAYLDSLWMNRPDSDYYRRSGAEAYLTGHFDERVTVGVEYRYDRYEGLTPLDRVWTIFNQTEHAAANPTFAPVEAGSIVGRAEFNTDPHPLEKVGDRRRDLERSLIKFERAKDSGFNTVNTVEVADPSLGGTASYTRVVSDSRLYLASGESSGLLLRVRGAGENGAVPLPKQETLGGWDALRGYEHDEFRGDRSILGTVEYHWEIVGVFADAGDVRQLGGAWYTPRLGLGAELAFGDFARLEVAWRTDSQATAAPSARLLFERTF